MSDHAFPGHAAVASAARATASASHAMVRDLRIDAAKAISIVLVMLGHARGTPSDLNLFTGSFRVPLFFAVSGWLFGLYGARRPLSVAARRLGRALLVPYASFFVVGYAYWLLTRHIGDKAARWGDTPWWEPLTGLVTGIGPRLYVHPAIWFLPALFVTALAYLALRRRWTDRQLLPGVLCVALAWASLFPATGLRLPFALDVLPVSLFFYVIGAWASGVVSLPASRVASVVFAVLLAVPLWWLASGNGRIDVNFLKFGHAPWQFFIAALLGTGIVLLLSRLVQASPVVQWIGRNTLLILCTHILIFFVLSGVASRLGWLARDATPGFEWSVLITVIALLACVPLRALLQRIAPWALGDPASAVRRVAVTGCAAESVAVASTSAHGAASASSASSAAAAQPIRVVHVVRQYHPSVGGLEDVVANLARHHIDSGAGRAEVVTLDRMFGRPDARLPAHEVHDGVAIHRLPYAGSTRYPLCPTVLGALRAADVVHVHGIDFFYDYLALARPLHGKPLLVSTHGGFFHTAYASRLKSLWFATITRASALAYRRVIATSDNDGAVFATVVAAQRLRVIENGVDVAKFRDRAATEPGRTLLYFGRWSSNKGLLSMLDLVAALVVEDPRWRLVIAGREYDVSREQLADAIAARGLDAHVEVVASPSRDALATLIGRCHYFVCLSRHEGFGLAAIEAMSAGLVPVLSDIPPFRKLVDGSGLGVLVPLAAPTDAAPAVHALADVDIATFTARRSAAMASASAHDWDHVGRRYAAEYRRAVRGDDDAGRGQ